jgi:hypothetical protein
MSTTRSRVRSAAVSAVLLIVALPVAPAAASSPSPSPAQVPPAWLHQAVASQDVGCAVSVTSDAVTAGRETLTEHIDCTVAMTHEMAEGDLSADITITFAPVGSAAGIWAGSFTISRERGSWDGYGVGAAVRATDGGRPGLFGEVDYRGSGDCFGLRYHQLLVGDDGAPSALSGYLDGSLEPRIYWGIARLPTLRIDALTLGWSSPSRT